MNSPEGATVNVVAHAPGLSTTSHQIFHGAQVGAAESVSQELDGVGAGEEARFGSASNQFLDGLLALFAVA